MRVFEGEAIRKARRWRGDAMKKPSFHMAWVLLLLIAAVPAHATSIGIDNAAIFDGILTRFANTAAGWGTKMVDYGTWLFWGLTLAWCGPTA